MRAFGTIGAAVLIACAIPAASRADDTRPASASPPQLSACDEPGPGVQKRAQRKVRRHVRHRRAPRAAPSPFVPVYYNPGLPSPYDSAYDRGMVLHFTSPPVSGVFRPEPPFPATPPIVGVQPYRNTSGPVVYQYDGLIGAYVRLAQNDPAQVSAPRPAAPPPPAPPPAK